MQINTLAPLPNRLLGHDDAPLDERIFRVAEAQRESMVQPDGVADDLKRESMPVIAGELARHRPTLPAVAST